MDRLIYHITHVENLPGIIEAGCIWSDAERRQGKCAAVRIGYTHIKDRRMNRRILKGPDGVLGDYVPFNFCPRSVMLYVISQGLVDGYSEGQGRVIHLVSSVEKVLETGQPYLFTDRHAEPPESEYFEDLADLSKLRWDIIEANNWGGDVRRPIKQAEFLVHEYFPWTGVIEIGARTKEVVEEVQQIVSNSEHRPPAQVHADWYY